MEVNGIMKKMMKRWMAALLSLTLILGGAGYFADEKIDTVKAGETEEKKEEIVEYGTYVWETLSYSDSATAPICKTEGYFFAGYYEEDKTTPVAEPVAGTIYQAKFVPTDVLTVKAQITKDVDTSGNTPASVRLITTVDSLNYKEVGFRLKTDRKDQPFGMTGVLRKITADNGAGAYNYSANIFDLASKYYATATFTNIKDHDTEFFVEPYWVTLDGTKVTGISRYMRISDSYSSNPDGGPKGYVNIPVYLNDTTQIGAGATITIDRKAYVGTNSVANSNSQYYYRDFEAGELFDASQIEVEEDGTKIIVKIKDGVTEKQAKGLLVNLRLQAKYKLSESQSRHLLSMTGTYNGNSIKVSDILHRNLEATSKDATLFCGGSPSTVVITNLAEFLGFVEWLSQSKMEGKTTLLATDLDFNPDWTASSTAPTVVYAPGYFSFAGTFDGQGHSIRGMYVKDGQYGNGLFAGIQATGTLKNLVMDNCYVGSTSKNAGVIAPTISGTVQNVEVKNSIVDVSAGTIGAFAGDFHGTAKEISATNCDIKSTSMSYVGGICGNLGGALENVSIQSCEISSKYFAGGINSYSNKATASIKNAVARECTISGPYGAGGITTDAPFPIDNVQVVGTNITGGNNYIGGIAGKSSNTIQKATVQGGTITGKTLAGGIAGKTTGNIIDSEVNGCTITATSTTAGVVPDASSLISNVKVVNTTLVGGTGQVGGIATSLTSTIRDVKVQGGTFESSGVVGGIVSTLNEGGNIEAAYCDAEVKNTGTTNPTGGIVGKVAPSTADGSVSIDDCWFAGQLNANLNIGGIVGMLDDQDTTISHCHNTGNIVTSTKTYIGGIVGYIVCEDSTVHTITIEDSFNFSKLTSSSTSGYRPDEGGIVGTFICFGATHQMNVNKTYSISDFFGATYSDRYASGWVRAFNSNKPYYVDGVEKSGQQAINRAHEWQIDTGEVTLPMTIDLTQGAADENCWWIVKDGEIRLKTFSDMEFKRY